MAETVDAEDVAGEEIRLLESANDYAELFKFHYAYQYVRKNWGTLFGGKTTVSLTEIQQAIVDNYLNIKDESSRTVYSVQPTMEEVSKAMANAKKMTGKGTVKSAMADIGGQPKKIVDEYAKYKENKEGQLESLRQNADESAVSYQESIALNKNAKRKRFWSVIGKGATILVTGLLAGGYVLGAFGLAGGFAGLTSIATMPFAMLSVATGFLLFKAGGWIVKKIWKKLSNAYKNANTLINGEEPGSDKYMKQAKSQARTNANAYMHANMPSNTVSSNNERARDLMESMLGGVVPVADEEMIEFEDEHNVPPPHNPENTTDPDKGHAGGEGTGGNPKPKNEKNDKGENIIPPQPKPGHNPNPDNGRAGDGGAGGNPKPKNEKNDKGENIIPPQPKPGHNPNPDNGRAGGEGTGGNPKPKNEKNDEGENMIPPLPNPEHAPDPGDKKGGENEYTEPPLPNPDKGHAGDGGAGRNPKPKNEKNDKGENIIPPQPKPGHNPNPDNGRAGDGGAGGNPKPKNEKNDKGENIIPPQPKPGHNPNPDNGRAGGEGTGGNPDHRKEKPAGHKKPETTAIDSIVKDSHDEYDPDQLTICLPLDKIDPKFRHLFQTEVMFQEGDRDRLKQLFAKKSEEMTAREKQEYIELAEAFMHGPKSKEEAQMADRVYIKGIKLQNNITDEELKRAKNNGDEQPNLE